MPLDADGAFRRRRESGRRVAVRGCGYREAPGPPQGCHFRTALDRTALELKQRADRMHRAARSVNELRQKKFRAQSWTRMFFWRAMSVHFEPSSRPFFASTSGVPPAGSKPILAKLSFAGGSASTALSLVLTRSITACGVFAGANSPYHVVTSNPGSALSAMVGVSANTCQRWTLPTASSLTCPARIAGTPPLPSKVYCTRPAIRSTSAGAPPLYGDRKSV